ERADMLVGDAVEVRLMLHVAVAVDEPNDDFARVVWTRGQGLKMRPFRFEHVGDRPTGIGVGLAHRARIGPPRKHFLEVLETRELAAVQQVLLDETEGPLDFALEPSAAPRGDGEAEVVEG